ncbi:FGFR1 oncogene partner 2 homolog [Drosophila bipectinata]|uniref:FGFR1 oncogene partner 2 homolog n=1 Tax=Drosophila bipectinata TaxID=42026 RepID=UPI001C8AD434|nr:FGFR1 oncogene partner 2 homolog [Drosophila bipectinata]
MEGRQNEEARSPISAGLIGVLLKNSQEIASGLANMEATTDSLIALGESVNQDLMNCCKYREELVLKHLAENNKEDEQMMMLRENSELKATVDEYQQGINIIMSKHRENSDGIFDESFAVKERYMNGMRKIVDDQNARIEHMLEVMKLTADLEDLDSDGNQRIIRQLADENEEMRRQLQISTADPMLKQRYPKSTESSTQFEASDAADPATLRRASSLSSLESFISCLSKGITDGDASPTGNSLVSQLDIRQFIDEALADDPAKQPE